MSLDLPKKEEQEGRLFLLNFLKLEKEKVKKCFLDLTQHSRLGGQSLTVESAAGKHKLCSGLGKIKK